VKNYAVVRALSQLNPEDGTSVPGLNIEKLSDPSPLLGTMGLPDSKARLFSTFYPGLE
jgi:hypothetical protein